LVVPEWWGDKKPYKIMDVLEGLKKLPDNCVQCVVTSPPYWGLRDYGTATWEGGDPECNHMRDTKISDSCTTGHQGMKGQGVADAIYKTECKKCGAKRVDQQLGLEETPDEYITKMVEVFHEVKRVMRKDGTLWLNMGDCYVCSPPGNKEPSKADKDGNYWRARERQLGQGEDVEAIYQKSKIKSLKPKDLVGMPWRLALALQADGWYLRSDIIWHKPNPMPESVTDRPTKSHEYIFLLTKSAKYYYDAEAIREKTGEETRRAKSFRDGGVYTNNRSFNNSNTKEKDTHGDGDNSYMGRNKRDVWTVTTRSYSEAHFATFPPDLILPCILAGTKEGDIVLDPFLGSGTTAEVSRLNNRTCLGFELNPDYEPLILTRSYHELKKIDEWEDKSITLKPL